MSKSSAHVQEFGGFHETTSLHLTFRQNKVLRKWHDVVLGCILAALKTKFRLGRNSLLGPCIYRKSSPVVWLYSCPDVTCQLCLSTNQYGLNPLCKGTVLLYDIEIWHLHINGNVKFCKFTYFLKPHCYRVFQPMDMAWIIFKWDHYHINSDFDRLIQR